MSYPPPQPLPTPPPTPAPIPDPVTTPPRRTDIKDTLESILIALILAFVFRAYIVEAYVIPTGSMATTLLGAHMRFTCPDCSHEFTTNYTGAKVAGSDDVDIPKFAGPVPVQGRLVPRDFLVVCPNCGNKIPRPPSPTEDGDNDARNPAVYYGDRILVQKYLYLIEEPRRWDVVVFKSPYDQPTFQQNYIKRLVGLPGEQLMALDGDVYTRKSPAAPWQVQRKTRDVQQALWRLVYDNDQLPKGTPRVNAPFKNPWSAGTGDAGWSFAPDGNAAPAGAPSAVPSAVPSTDTGTRRLVCSQSPKPAVLKFNPDANPDQHALTDFLAFDITAYQQSGYYADTYSTALPRTFYAHPVSDLKLQCVLSRSPDAGTGDGSNGADGAFVMSLGKQGKTFSARFTRGAVELTVADDGKAAEGKPATSLAKAALNDAGPLQIEFASVDYRVSVRVNGREVLATTDAQYAPDIERLLAQHRHEEPVPAPTVSLAAENLACTVEHLSLWRDIHYISRDDNDPSRMRWGTPENPVELGPDEFFVMGDNAALSLDARYWTDPIDIPLSDDLYTASGRVPRRFMLGKAFMVYWPAGKRPWNTGPGVIPSFGQMRFIH